MCPLARDNISVFLIGSLFFFAQRRGNRSKGLPVENSNANFQKFDTVCNWEHKLWTILYVLEMILCIERRGKKVISAVFASWLDSHITIILRNPPEAPETTAQPHSDHRHNSAYSTQSICSHPPGDSAGQKPQYIS